MNFKNRSVKYLFSISLFTAFLSHVCLYSQKTETLYGSSIEPGSEIYVMTNRVAEITDGNLMFSNVIKDDPSLMYLAVKYINPDSLQITELDSSVFITAISKFTDDCVFFVHGDSKTFNQSVFRGLDIQNFHKVNVILFSWPSKDPEINGAKNFKRSKQNVLKSLDHFITALKLIEIFKQLNPIFQEQRRLSLFTHSLGNYYLENMINNNLVYNIHPDLFNNIILNAAAVNQDFHSEWVEKLNIQQQIYITSNKQDFNLKGVRIFTKDGKQLGEKVKHPLAQNAIYINFTKAVGFRLPTGTTHTYFIGKTPEKSLNIRNFFSTVLHGNSVNLNNSNHFEKRKDNLGYNMIF